MATELVQKILAHLEANNKVLLAQVTEQEMPLKDEQVTLVEFHIAPKNGIYKASRLQDFAVGLSDSLRRTISLNRYDFEVLPHEHDGRLYFGEIGYDTLLGHNDAMTGLEVKQMGLTDPRSVIKVLDPMKVRKATIWTYPNQAIALDIITQGGPFIHDSISLKDLKKYKPGLIGRILGRK